MFYSRNLIAMLVVILGLVIFVPAAQAERQEFEAISCFTNTTSTLHATPGEIFVGSFDGTGILRSTHEKKLLDNNTFRQVAVLKLLGGVWTWNGNIKVLDPSGDYHIWEFYGDGKSGSTMKLIYGTGKFKGAKGEQKTIQITAGKPIVTGTNQMCTKCVGWIEFAK